MVTLPITAADISYAQLSQAASPSGPVQNPGLDSLNGQLNFVAPIAFVALVLGMVWQRRRSCHRQVLRQQRENLERIWQLSSTQ